MAGSRAQGGFTLFEAVVSIVVLGILFALAAPMLSSGVRAFDEVNDGLETLGRLRLATERIARELRQVRRNPAATDQYDIASTVTNPAATLSFTRLDSDGVTPVQVTVTTGGGAARLAYDTVAGGSAFVLAPGVSSLQFNFYQSDGTTPATGAGDVEFVEIDLTLTNTAGAGYRQRTRVALRNRQ